MTTPQEVFSFMNKFLHLCGNRENANLSLQCEHGRVSVNLQVHLRPDNHPPPRSPNPTPRPTPCHQPRPYPSPSRLRRSKRRAHARERQMVKADETEKSPKDDALNKADVEVLKSKIQKINSPAEQVASDASGNVDLNFPTKAETMTPEKGVVPNQNLSTNDVVPKDDKFQDEVTPKNDIGEVDHSVNQDDFDAACNKIAQTTKPSDEQVPTAKLLNELSRDEFFEVLKNALDLSKPP